MPAHALQRHNLAGAETRVSGTFCLARCLRASFSDAAALDRSGSHAAMLPANACTALRADRASGARGLDPPPHILACAHLIEITFGLDSSRFGTSMVSTPFSNVAFTWSVSALSAKVKERLNVP